MKIIVFGSDNRVAEFRASLNDIADLEIDRGDSEPGEDFKEYDAVFDLNFDDDSAGLPEYARLKDKWVFVSAVKQSLAEAVYHSGAKVNCKLVGMNALPGFIHRDLWELSVLKNYYVKDIQSFLSALGKTHELVADRTGMVSARVICMLINEAAYAIQEKTAEVESIDLAMKLGTNYPLGPLEWCDKIGITDVFETLMSVYQDTLDERYRVCPLLKRKYLLNEKFLR